LRTVHHAGRNQVEAKYISCVFSSFLPAYGTCLNVALIAFRPFPENNVHFKATIFSLQRAPWGAEPEFELWSAIHQANELTTELRRTLTEPHRTLAELHSTLAKSRPTLTNQCRTQAELRRTLIKLCLILAELRRTLAELRRTLAEIRRTLTKLRLTLTELRRTVAELRRTLTKLCLTPYRATPYPS
jgi:hypothetical protein